LKFKFFYALAGIFPVMMKDAGCNNNNYWIKFSSIQLSSISVLGVGIFLCVTVSRRAVRFTRILICTYRTCILTWPLSAQCAAQFLPPSLALMPTDTECLEHLHLPNVPGSNLDAETGCIARGPVSFFSAPPGKCWDSTSYHHRFLPNSFQFIII
jgi:hypothetical protein